MSLKVTVNLGIIKVNAIQEIKDSKFILAAFKQMSFTKAKVFWLTTLNLILDVIFRTIRNATLICGTLLCFVVFGA